MNVNSVNRKAHNYNLFSNVGFNDDVKSSDSNVGYNYDIQ